MERFVRRAGDPGGMDFGMRFYVCNDFKGGKLFNGKCAYVMRKHGIYLIVLGFPIDPSLVPRVC